MEILQAFLLALALVFLVGINQRLVAANQQRGWILVTSFALNLTWALGICAVTNHASSIFAYAVGGAIGMQIACALRLRKEN